MPTCFVIMGFGEKTDFQANPQRLLNLDRTYEQIIEPAVKASGLTCVRADKIVHSTVIDKPMYEYLNDADLVVADLSTSNANAIYELGVRHALRPYKTIVMAEQGFKFPFDLNHLSILKYEHMGKGILYEEVERAKAALQARIVAALQADEVDSPVFMFLPQRMGKPAAAAAAEAAVQDQTSLADLMELLTSRKQKVQKPDDWLAVLKVLDRLKNLQPNDPFVVQQQALATYKSESPDAVASLVAAKDLLAQLLPETSCDAETVGLWGAIHKRLWEKTKNAEDLSQAIRAYARGYFIKNDYYNGVNFAFLLNVRASISSGEEAIGDRVLARRVRGELLALCDTAEKAPGLKDEDRFWIAATKMEVLVGLGRVAEADSLKTALKELPVVQPWMMATMDSQLAKLTALNP